jgi:MYXO-CTERM domain-containing protein
MRATCGLLSLLCVGLPGALRADTMYSLTDTYGAYNVSISFDTSLTGSALDNLSSNNITSTVSDFVETNTIPGNGSASLNVTISTNSLGNITAFSITDASDQVVTNTEDSGETAGTPATSTTYSAPPTDGDGSPLIGTVVPDPGHLDAFYEDGNLCEYDTSDGALFDDEVVIGSCPATAVEHPGSPAIPPAPVNASGTGTFTSNPPNPGATQAAVPEINSGALLSTLAGLLALAAWRRRRSDSRKAAPGAPPIPAAIAAKG